MIRSERVHTMRVWELTGARKAKVCFERRLCEADSERMRTSVVCVCVLVWELTSALREECEADSEGMRNERVSVCLET